MIPRPIHRRVGLALLLSILLWLSAPIFPQACDGQTDAPGSLEIRARWIAGRGTLYRGGTLILRLLDAERVSLAISLPDLPFLPGTQYLLREGESLLAWESPAAAHPLLSEDSPLWALLAALPPPVWSALLSGEELAKAMDLEGGTRLGGRPARLRFPDSRAQVLDWEGPDGHYRFRWRSGPHPGARELVLATPDGLNLRIFSRKRTHTRLSRQEWLFLED